MPFHPRRHGFRFANRFDVPIAGAVLRAAGAPATWGLCGGLVDCARHAYRAGVALPRRTTPPAPGTRLYRNLLRRQIATLGPPLFAPVWRFARWTRCSDDALALPTRRTFREARRLLLSDGDTLVPLGLVYARHVRRLQENHQVLAYALGGARAGAQQRALRIYDPNEPRRDDVTLAPSRASSSPGGPSFEKRVAGRYVRSVRGAFLMGRR